MKMKGQVKTAKDSSIEVIQQMTQHDANLAGFVHGGVIMKIIDNTAGIVASRHTQANVVTASIDRLDFHSPVFVGDLLRIMASINLVGRTSMEVGVRVEAENFITGDVRHTASAYLTFVLLDEHQHKLTVPPIVFETEDEKRRSFEAIERKKLRRVMQGKANDKK
jgi:uncharacterized protein (TIGR00369 family)